MHTPTPTPTLPSAIPASASTTVERSCGRAVEVTRVGSVGGAPTHIIFVPGNPGIPAYYGSTVEMLAEQLGATAAVVGFLGHSATPTSSPVTQTFGLPEQCEHVCSFIESERAHLERLRQPCEKEDGEGPNIVLVGHSIGAYVAFSAAKRAGLFEGKIGSVPTCAVGLMPFLEHNELPSLQSRVRAASAWWAPALFIVLSVIGQLVGKLPFFVKKLIFRAVEKDASRFSPEMVDLTLNSIPRFDTLYNILTLFRTEAQLLQPPYDHKSLKYGLDGKLALLYAGGDLDMWAPSSSAKRAVEQGVDVTIEDGLPHAFSVTPASRQRVVDLICSMLASMPS